MYRNVATKSPTSTNGRGDADSLLNVSDNAIPVVRTAQLVVVSRRVRHTVLRYSSPRYRCDNAVMSAVLNADCIPSILLSLIVLILCRFYVIHDPNTRCCLAMFYHGVGAWTHLVSECR